MEEIKNNKYLLELDKYIKNTEENKIDLKKCAELRKKAKDLRKNMSLKLLSYISTFSKVDLKIVEEYLKNGADVNYKFYDDMTLYMYAGLYNHLELLQFLKEQGADVLAVNKYKKNALVLVAVAESCKNNSNFSFLSYIDYEDVLFKLVGHIFDKDFTYPFIDIFCEYIENPLDQTVKTQLLKYFHKEQEETL